MRILLLLTALTASAIAATNEVADTSLSQKAELVIRGKASPPEEGKYLTYHVEVLEVLKNNSGVTVSNQIQAFGTHRSPLPKGEILLYLERFEKQTPRVPKGNWRVIGMEKASEKR
jgi:hypothetical protein